MNRVRDTAPSVRSKDGWQDRVREDSGPAQLSWWVAALLQLTTERYRDDPAIDRRIAAHLGYLQVRGWLVRTAGPRNYVAWRNSDSLSEAVPVIVLPNRDFPFSRQERNAAFLRELLIAEVRKKNPGSFERNRLLARLVQRLVVSEDYKSRELAALFARIDRKVAQGLIGVWPRR
jgi:hypothetical protein